MSDLTTIEGVATVERIEGAAAAGAPPRLLVECPHGATERAHYDALAARMQGELPADLHEFFHVNTDVGSWEVGRRVAERVVAARPELAVLVVRCLIPRTLVDVNRVVDARAGDLAHGGLTAALPPYVHDDADRALLVDLHRRYTDCADQAYRMVCGEGGLALVQHTYGPVTLGIDAVDAHIVDNLRAAHDPEVYASWPVRPEVDLITADEQGRVLAPEGMGEALVQRYGDLGVPAVQADSYVLHPSTMGRVWSERYPGQTLCVEIRRDLLVEAWRWNQPMQGIPEQVDRLAGPLAEELGRRC